KCGVVINALAGSDDSSLPNEKINALCQANGISVRLELGSILNELERQRLIDKGENGIEILGLTSEQVLENTSVIFEESLPRPCERAAIDLSEQASNLPVQKGDAVEYVSDTYRITPQET